MSDDEERDAEEQLAELTTQAKGQGFRVVHDPTWGYVLWRIGKPTTNPHTHSNADLAELREMLDGIEWGRAAWDYRRNELAPTNRSGPWDQTWGPFSLPVQHISQGLSVMCVTYLT